ncbi:hypothetical protein COU54_04660 [Candidatus Pacearchaeota archaeon CG10_big_fil_rev_8_21_14_0_10_31_24]|nr:MAG: hypothetical protein COU54_04660 [Candidatus Pacearchaeota archaeon CG10_big_fil_rev_8_21_14_0_10_31_24]
MPFENIFSKKRTKPIQKTKIIIDNRERNSLVPIELEKLNFEIEFQQLEIGDYLLKNIIIERKTLSDLKSSIINKRIFQQLENMQKYPNALLIIEKDSNNLQANLHENSLRGFLLAATLDYKIPFIFAQNSLDTAKYIQVLSKKESKEISMRHSKRQKTKKENQQFILEGFPNIGPKKAKLLLERFKSLKNIFNASEKELEEVLGKKNEEFKNLLD